MLNWYQTKDNIKSARHKGVNLEGGKHVLMTDKQAALHNKKEEKLVKAKPPETILDCQFPKDFTDYLEQVKEKPEQEQAKNQSKSEKSKDA